jgi:hypothetical protein
MLHIILVLHDHHTITQPPATSDDFFGVFHLSFSRLSGLAFVKNLVAGAR